MSPEPDETCAVAIVGGGPSGLALATALRRDGVGKVVVLERDAQAGGVPRHCGHYPFGVHEFGRLLKGPDYARRHVDQALAAGVDIRTGVTVTDLQPGGTLVTSSSNEGMTTLRGQRVVLCTGARETSRAQRFISGTRPQGVISTGALQAFVYLENLVPFRRPVILGTELVSFSALLTCRHAGIRPVAMIEPKSLITARAFSRGLPALLRIPLHLGTRVKRIIGQARVEGIEVEDAQGKSRIISADGLICSGQFRPEAALLHNSHLDVDPGTGGPSVDQFARCSDPAYLGAGNLLRPVETHTWCAAEGQRAARMVVDALDQPQAQAAETPVQVSGDGLRYALPQRLAHLDGRTAYDDIQLRVTRPVRGRLVLRADDTEIWARRIKALPERRILAPLAPALAHRGKRIIVTLEEGS